MLLEVIGFVFGFPFLLFFTFFNSSLILLLLLLDFFFSFLVLLLVVVFVCGSGGSCSSCDCSCRCSFWRFRFGAFDKHISVYTAAAFSLNGKNRIYRIWLFAWQRSFCLLYFFRFSFSANFVCAWVICLVHRQGVFRVWWGRGLHRRPLGMLEIGNSKEQLILSCYFQGAVYVHFANSL